MLINPLDKLMLNDFLQLVQEKRYNVERLQKQDIYRLLPRDREGRTPLDELKTKLYSDKTQWYCVAELEQAGHWFLKKIVSYSKEKIYDYFENYDSYKIVVMLPIDNNFIEV